MFQEIHTAVSTHQPITKADPCATGLLFLTLDFVESKLDELTEQVQRVTLGLAQHGELLSSISNTPEKKKSRSSIGTSKGTPKKKEPHSLELVETDDIDYLKLAGHTHIRVIMGRTNACAPLPSPPSDDEKRQITTSVSSVSASPGNSVHSTSVNHHLADHGVISKDFAEYIETSLSRVGLLRFTYDWDGRFEDQYNQFALQFFLRTFKQGLAGAEYGATLRQPVDNFDLKLTAFFYVHLKTLKAQFRAQLKNPQVLSTRKDAGRVRKAKRDRCNEYLQYLSEMGVDPKLINIFNDYHVMGEEVIDVDSSHTKRSILIPSWWSAKFLQFMIELERRVQISILAKKLPGPRRTLRQFVVPTTSTIETSNVPKQLPEDCYSKQDFLNCLLPVQLKSWDLQPPIIPDDVNRLFHSSNVNASNPTSISKPTHSDIRSNTSNTANRFENQSEFPEGMFEDDEAMVIGENK